MKIRLGSSTFASVTIAFLIATALVLISVNAASAHGHAGIARHAGASPHVYRSHGYSGLIRNLQRFCGWPTTGGQPGGGYQGGGNQDDGGWWHAGHHHHRPGGGNQPPPVTDTTPPTAPGDVQAIDVTQTAATLIWQPSTDDVAMDHYEVIVDGDSLGTTADTTFGIDLKCGQSVVVNLVAFDTSGNSGVAEPLIVTALDCDSTGPTGEPTGPTSEPTGPTSEPTGPTSEPTGPTSEPTGPTSEPTGPTSEPTGPTTEPTGPTGPPIDDTPPSAPSDLAESDVTATSATVSWTASTDAVGVVRYDITLGSTLLASTPSTSTSITLDCGTTVTIVVTAYDAAGNASTGSPLDVTAAACPAAPPVPTGVGGSWKLVLGDDFDGTSLDTSIWEPWRIAGPSATAPFNPALENASYSPDNVSVTNGALTLKVQPAASGSDYPYTSGMIQSGNNFSFFRGFVEARIKVDACDGCWPAFWLLDEPTSGNVPTETDILEYFDTATDRRPYFNFHWNNYANQLGVTHYGDTNTDYTSDWHTYGLLWTASGFQVYLDGQPGPTYTDTSSLPTVPDYVLFNLAVQKGQTPPAGSSMSVDYLRVWQPN